MICMLLQAWIHLGMLLKSWHSKYSKIILKKKKLRIYKNFPMPNVIGRRTKCYSIGTVCCMHYLPMLQTWGHQSHEGPSVVLGTNVFCMQKTQVWNTPLKVPFYPP